MKLVYISSSENVADILTKSSRKHTFIYLRDKIMSDPHKLVPPSMDLGGPSGPKKQMAK